MNLLREKQKSIGFHPCFGGRSSSSAATTNNTTTNTSVMDMRVVGGDDSNNVSAYGSNVTIVATDHGAVAGGIQLGTSALDKAAGAFKQSLDYSGAAADKALNFSRAAGADALDFSALGMSKAFDFAKDANAKAAGGTADAFQSALASVGAANDNLAKAYQSGQAGDQTQLKYAGFVVVGLAVVMLLPSLVKK